MKHFSFLFLFFFLLNASAQKSYVTLSENAEVSILTVGPGKQLFDKFGHTAIRVKGNGLDVVFNYGVYDFNTPNFYTKFARGKLLYKLGTGRFDAFLQQYQRQNRYVHEQILDLNPAQKTAFFEFLANNAEPENCEYLYDFLFDNCATKPRDVLKEILGNSLKFDDSYLEEKLTFRELIQKNVSANTWGSLGMDVAIGAVVDKEATPWEHQFLPEYVYEAAKTATVNGKPLVRESRVLFENTPMDEKNNFFLSPIFVFGLIGLLILFVTYRDVKKGSRSRFLDATLFGVTGFIGIFLLLLWFATDHSTTANNYNLLWAFPISLFAMFQIAKRKPKLWVRRYVILLLLMLVLLCMHWISGIQGFAIGLVPLFIALAARYVFLLFFLKKDSVPA